MKSAAVIVSAGLSSRMGSFKPLLPLESGTVIEHAVSPYIAIGADPIVVVTGYRKEELEQRVRLLPVTCVENPLYAQTDMLKSVQIGLESLPPDIDVVFVTPGDIPLVASQTLLALLASERDAAVPVFESQKGHPLMMRAHLVPGACSYRGAGGLRGYLESSGATVSMVAVNDPAVTMDMDTPDDYDRILALCKKSSSSDRARQ